MCTFKDTSYNQFRKSAAEFFKATQDRTACSHEQAENGNKALGLLYVGGRGWTEQQDNSAVIILELATKRCMEVFLANAIHPQ